MSVTLNLQIFISVVLSDQQVTTVLMNALGFLRFPVLLPHEPQSDQQVISHDHEPWNMSNCYLGPFKWDILPYLVPVKSWQRAAFRLHMESPPPISQSPHFLICDIWQWNESLECISGNHLLLANWIVPLLLIPPSEVLLAWMTVPFFMLALTCSCSY